MFMGPRFLLVALLALVATHSASAEASVAMATKVSHHKAAEAVRELSGMAIPTRIPARELSVGLGNPKAAEAVRELSVGLGNPKAAAAVRELSVGLGNPKAAEAVRELSGMAIPTRIPARELSVGLGIPKAAEADRELLGVYIPTSTPRRRLRLPYRSE